MQVKDCVELVRVDTDSNVRNSEESLLETTRDTARHSGTRDPNEIKINSKHTKISGWQKKVIHNRFPMKILKIKIVKRYLHRKIM